MGAVGGLPRSRAADSGDQPEGPVELTDAEEPRPGLREIGEGYGGHSLRAGGLRLVGAEGPRVVGVLDLVGLRARRLGPAHHRAVPLGLGGGPPGNRRLGLHRLRFRRPTRFLVVRVVGVHDVAVCRVRAARHAGLHEGVLAGHLPVIGAPHLIGAGPLNRLAAALPRQAEKVHGGVWVVRLALHGEGRAVVAHRHLGGVGPLGGVYRSGVRRLVLVYLLARVPLVLLLVVLPLLNLALAVLLGNVVDELARDRLHVAPDARGPIGDVQRGVLLLLGRLARRHIALGPVLVELEVAPVHLVLLSPGLLLHRIGLRRYALLAEHARHIARGRLPARVRGLLVAADGDLELRDLYVLVVLIGHSPSSRSTSAPS